MKALFCLGLIAASLPAGALTEQFDLDGVRVTIYAPDWTWQRQSVNVLVVAENTGPAPRDVIIELVPPKGLEDHFKLAHETTLSFQAQPGEAVRRAFTDIYANDGVPRQVYPFEFSARVGDARHNVPYALQTVRGSATSSARWALYLPVIVALAWSLIFALVLPRLAQPKAWRTSQAVVFPDMLEESRRG